MERDSIPFSFEKFVERAREMQATKRDLLSLLAVLFDPLGLISPMLVRMKMLFQHFVAKNGIGTRSLKGNRERNSVNGWRIFPKSKGFQSANVSMKSKTKGSRISAARIWGREHKSLLRCSVPSLYYK